jgi:hypothetical protein
MGRRVESLAIAGLCSYPQFLKVRCLRDDVARANIVGFGGPTSADSKTVVAGPDLTARFSPEVPFSTMQRLYFQTALSEEGPQPERASRR